MIKHPHCGVDGETLFVVTASERKFGNVVSQAGSIPASGGFGRRHVKSPEKVADKYHMKCHDCGRFVKKEERVPKDHPWKKHALCFDCLSNYDDFDHY